MYAAGVLDATEASVDSAGSWIPACLCGAEEAVVELDEGREMSWLIDGRGVLSWNAADGVLSAGSSNASREDMRKAWGRGKTVVASVAAVMDIGVEKRVGRFS